MMACLIASRGARVTYVDSDLGRIVYAFRHWRGEPFAEKAPQLLVKLEACVGKGERLMTAVWEHPLGVKA